MYWQTFCMISCIKLLLIYTYTSTDFEVHRNWLAITHNLPIREWYTESTSHWTLDYPPLFAWFEWVLSQFALYFDPEMLSIRNLNYKSFNAVFFQRLSVIVCDFALAFSVKECSKYLHRSNLRKSSKWKDVWSSPTAVMGFLILCNSGLIMVDHMHFQYNGFLLGILLLSITRMLEDRKLEGATWFAILLNLKHLYAYIAPVYAVYLLRTYCLPGHVVSFRSVKWNNCCKLATMLATIFVISFGPFIYHGQFKQVMERLFPFKRGLSHSYWAPNFWAIYNFTDRILALIAKMFKYNISSASMTRGLVQDFEHSVLPSVSPKFTFLLTILAMLPCLIKLWKCWENRLHFVRCVVLCSMTGFMFGWHVHEKAILTTIIPLTILAVIWKQEASIFLMLSTIGNYSMFPLLPNGFETLLKILLFAAYCTYAFWSMQDLFNSDSPPWALPLLGRYESIYLFSLIALLTFDLFGQYALGVNDKYPFLPLMLTSTHNAFGIGYLYVKYYKYMLSMNEFDQKRKTY